MMGVPPPLREPMDVKGGLSTIWRNWFEHGGLNVGPKNNITVKQGANLTVLDGGSLNIKGGGGINLDGGGDITLAGDDSNPGIIKFSGSSADVTMGLNASSSAFSIIPDTTNFVSLLIGSTGAIWSSLGLVAKNTGVFITGFTDSDNSIRANWLGNSSNAVYEMRFRRGGVNKFMTFIWSDTVQQLNPNTDKEWDIGTASLAFDDMYADDFNNVADFLHLDDYSDLEVLNGISPSGEIDPRSGLPLIDDATLPEWLLVKKDNIVERDSSGKPYLALKTIISLCMGAIRELDKKIESVKKSKRLRKT